MELTLKTYLIVCPLVFLAGLVDSVAGGGGLISLPGYYLAGLPPVMAAGTNKLSAGLGCISASLRYIRGKQVDWHAALYACLGAFPGSWLGVHLLQRIPENTIRLMMVIAIPLVALLMLRKGSDAPRRIVDERFYRPAALAIGLFVGFYDGLIGPGTGTFLILLFTMALGIEPVMASGTAKVVNLASNLTAQFTLILSGEVIFALGLPAAACGIIGNWLGAGLTMKKGAGFIHWMMLGVLALLLAKMVLDML